LNNRRDILVNGGLKLRLASQSAGVSHRRSFLAGELLQLSGGGLPNPAFRERRGEFLVFEKAASLRATRLTARG